MKPADLFFWSQVVYDAIVLFWVIPAIIGCGLDVYRMNKRWPNTSIPKKDK